MAIVAIEPLNNKQEFLSTDGTRFTVMYNKRIENVNVKINNVMRTEIPKNVLKKGSTHV